MNYTVVGTCGKCGGEVVIPAVWMSTVQPTPQCRSCGSYKKENLPVLEMQESTKKEFLVE